MSADVSITVDVDRSLIHMTLKGVFDEADIERFRAEREDAHWQLRSKRNEHVTLVDIRELGPQSEASLEAFSAFMRDDKKRSLRLAFVTGPMRSKLQVRRAAGDREVGYFTDIGQARTWLLDRRSTLSNKPGAPPGWHSGIFK